MRLGRTFRALTLSLALSSGAYAGLSDASIGSLATKQVQDELVVSFQLVDAIDQQVLERLHSGFELKFQHEVDLISPRGALLPNKLIAGTEVKTSVAYDNLTQQYRLFRQTRARGGLTAPSLFEVDITRKTQSLQEAVQWMTNVNAVTLPWGSIPEQYPRVKLRVQTDLGRRWLMYVIPSRHSVSAELGLEF